MAAAACGQEAGLSRTGSGLVGTSGAGFSMAAVCDAAFFARGLGSATWRCRAFSAGRAATSSFLALAVALPLAGGAGFSACMAAPGAAGG
ncbi:MAG TPA: hypothetical protein VNO52_15410, partial [Methylomirabilota bacterium]|nr:hypothetical protein [Methylomirabilota bacterium]